MLFTDLVIVQIFSRGEDHVTLVTHGLQSLHFLLEGFHPSTGEMLVTLVKVDVLGRLTANITYLCDILMHAGDVMFQFVTCNEALATLGTKMRFLLIMSPSNMS